VNGRIPRYHRIAEALRERIRAGELRPGTRLENQRQAEESELKALEFVEWRRGVGPGEVSAIVPDVVRHAPRASESALRAHFDENVWPSRRAEIPGAIDAERAEIARQVDQSLGIESGRREV